MLFIFMSISAICLLLTTRVAYLLWKDERDNRTAHAISENFVGVEIDGIDFNVGVEGYSLN
jgi:hypothetical protein